MVRSPRYSVRLASCTAASGIPWCSQVSVIIITQQSRNELLLAINSSISFILCVMDLALERNKLGSGGLYGCFCNSTTEDKLVPLPIPHRPWSHLGVDFATDLPPSNGFTTILVVVDRFSKSCKLIPLRGFPSALETAESLFQHIFRNFGLPEDIVSDRGPQFTSRVWRGFLHLLGVSVSLSSGYHPQTNGQTERKIQEIGRYLRAYYHEHQDSWSQFLPWAEYAQNSLRQETTGLTPFQCVLGYQPPLFPWTEERSEVPAVDHWFRESKRVWDSAHVHLQQAVRRHTANSDTRRSTNPIYQPGDRVWLSTRDIRLRLPCKKLSPRYIGPFRVMRRINEVTYRLHLPDQYRISPTFHVSLLKPVTNPLLHPQSTSYPPLLHPKSLPPKPSTPSTKSSTPDGGAVGFNTS